MYILYVYNRGDMTEEAMTTEGGKKKGDRQCSRVYTYT